MGELIYGRGLAADMSADIRARVDSLRASGVSPRLAVLRAGERGEDVAYENGIRRTFEKLNIDVETVVLSPMPTLDEAAAAVDALNARADIHGVLVMRPLPSKELEALVRSRLAPRKDVDGMTDGSLAAVFSGVGEGCCPCTARAAMALAASLGDIKGKRAVVIGRSLVVGKPLAMLLLAANATVTVCHSRSVDLPAVCREADIVFAAVGRPRLVTKEFLRRGQWVIDVGTTYTPEGLVGDVAPDAVEVADFVTAVPGGVGAVTRVMLADNLLKNC